MPGKLRRAPTRQEGEKLLTGRWWWHGADACSQAVQHSTKPLPALQAETQPRQSLWLPTHTSYLKGTAVSQLTHLACAPLSVNLAVQ